MWVYGLPFQNGVVFHDKDSNTLRFSLRKIDFGYAIKGEIPVSFKRVEVFKVKADSAQVFGKMCVVGPDFVVGFLKHNGGIIEIEKQKDYLVGYLNCYKKGFEERSCSEASFVILQGCKREFLLKEYLRLVARENEIVLTPSSSFTVLTAGFRDLDQRIFEAKNCGCQVLLLRELEGSLEDFVRKCRNNGLLAGIEVEFEPVFLEKLRKHGFQFFEVFFEENDRNHVEKARQVLKDLVLVAKGVSPLTTIALTDGLVLKNAKMSLQDLVKNSLLQKITPLYVEVDDFTEEWLKVCGALGYGVIFNKRADRVDYAKVSCVGKVYAQQCEIICLDKNNVHKKFLVSKDSLRTEDELASRLVKHTKLRQDGRFFHFYDER